VPLRPHIVEKGNRNKQNNREQTSQDGSNAAVPHLLLQLEDELARSRKREAFWISVVVHIILTLVIFFAPELMPKWARPHLLRAEDLANAKEPTYLALPPDAQKPPPKVKSNRLSDKNRRAQTTRPPIEPKTLKQLSPPSLAGKPVPPGPPQAMPALPSLSLPAPGAPPNVARQPPPAQRPQPEPSPGQLTLEQPPAEGAGIPAPKSFPSTGSAGSLIAKATRAARPNIAAGGGEQYGMGTDDRNVSMGPFDILSDTQGVDFGPYLSRVLQSIKVNWYNLVPEEARPPLMKRGKVSIRFLITPSGKVTGLRVERPSGDGPLDRAAYGGITASDPFSPLPKEFNGPFLALRITFFYNPLPGEMEQEQ